MNRMSFERPDGHYDERIITIDEQLCALIKQRKEITNNNPGTPPVEYLSNWAEKFELYENLLEAVFGALANDQEFRPYVEPKGFIGHLPILKSVEKEEHFYSVTFVRQYENASVVNLTIDWDSRNDSMNDLHHHNPNFFELFISEQYDCKMDGGTGSTGSSTHSFIISPRLPDDMTGIDLVFRETKPFGESTDLEVVIHL